MNTAKASFNTTVRQTTEMSQRKKTLLETYCLQCFIWLKILVNSSLKKSHLFSRKLLHTQNELITSAKNYTLVHEPGLIFGHEPKCFQNS